MLLVLPNFACFPLIPEIFTDITAYTPHNVQILLLALSTSRAVPAQVTVKQDLAFELACPTVVALFCVELRVEGCIVHDLYDLHERCVVLPEIWDFNV